MDERIKVLVIEDEDAARIQLAKAIKKEGYDVLQAENGEVGMEVFQKEDPLIIVTDIKMPKVSGLEVLERVKKISPNTQKILITAFGEVDTAITAIREGVLDYIKKPIDLDQLSVALGRAKEVLADQEELKLFPSILLAEDETETRERLAKVLTKEGYKVHAACDGEEALALFLEHKIDVLLTDIRMPKKTGLEALSEMRAISEDFEAIVLTGYGDEASVIEALRLGAINFIKKPIDLEQMGLIVEKALEKLNLHRSLNYRKRELQLKHELITRITSKGIVINPVEKTDESNLNFMHLLLNALPLDFVVFTKDLDILHMNDQFAAQFDYSPEKIDEKFLGQMDRFGIKDLSLDVLKEKFDKALNSDTAEIETIKFEKYAFLTILAIKLYKEKKECKVVLMVIRGQRG